MQTISAGDVMKKSYEMRKFENQKESTFHRNVKIFLFFPVLKRQLILHFT
jgi:hypothetical protein